MFGTTELRPPPSVEVVESKLEEPVNVDSTPASALTSPVEELESFSRLGKHITKASQLLQEKSWAETVYALRTPNDFSPEVATIPHPAGRYLDYLRKHGAPTKLQTTPWSADRIEQAITRGPHKSAHQYAGFLYGEMADMCDKGQWMVLPYSQVKNVPGLRISPIGVVPQHDRRPRTIVDYSFYDVNDETVPLAPAESMQFGKALDRLLWKIHQADSRHGPVYISKADMADGFYRLHTQLHSIPALGVAFPSAPDGTRLVAFPLAMPMGAGPSPPFFCSVTETVADMTNAATKQHEYRNLDTPHPLEPLAETPPAPEDPSTAGGVGTHPDKILESQPLPPKPHKPRRKPLAYTDVFVDDFIQLVQGSRSRRRKLRRLLYKYVDKVFRPLDPSDPSSRQQPISEKKLRKGDAHWETRKTVLGWIVDTIQETVSLPTRRLNRLHEILDDLPRTKRRISTQKWHKIIGELRSMTLAVPGLRGMFSLLQEAFRHEHKRRLKLSPALHDFLDDIRLIVQSLSDRPTRIAELFPSDPSVIQATDAAASGMGGVLFGPDSPPLLWREPFPEHINQAVVSWDNPNGSLTNSDLELAGTLGGLEVATSQFDLREQTISTLTDNTPALAWQQKGSTTTTGCAAYLLRLRALHQRHHRYVGQFAHVPGKANAMADDCSRLWHLSDEELLTHFNSTYPQAASWQLVPLSSEMKSALTSALQCTRPTVELKSLLRTKTAPTSDSGSSSANPSGKIPTWPLSKIQSSCSVSSPSESGTDAVRPAASLSALAQYLPLWRPLARASPWWGPRTLA